MAEKKTIKHLSEHLIFNMNQNSTFPADETSTSPKINYQASDRKSEYLNFRKVWNTLYFRASHNVRVNCGQIKQDII